MQHKSRLELYKDFVHFVQKDTQQERSVVKRRMFNVLLWCFVMPAICSGAILVLIKTGVFPYRYQKFSDWVILVFPVIYSVYFLGVEVAGEASSIFNVKRGSGFTGNLTQTLRNSEWRERKCNELQRAVHGTARDWNWICASFRVDLDAFRYRTRFLTALAGAVFFLIFQGMDVISGVPAHRGGGAAGIVNPATVFTWMELASNQMLQIAALVLFLVLLYLSGTETFHSLERYLNCADLLKLQLEERESHKERV